jgi:hypothetical protein
MPTTDLDAARRHHRALKQFFISSAPGEAPDLRALRRVLTLCDAASVAARDEYCRGKPRLGSGFRPGVAGPGDHAPWGWDSMTGSEFLRQQVLNALELLASRLYSLEALRRAPGQKGTSIWTTRSGIPPL